MASRVPFWDPITDGYYGDTYMDAYPWGLLVIGQQKMPGWTSCNASPGRKLDKKHAGGVDGSNPTVKGYEPPMVEITTTIWTPAQWEAFQAVAEILWPAVRKSTPTPFDVYHPELALYRISSVMIIGPKTPDKAPIEGARVFKWRCQEFQPNKGGKATTTPKKAVPVVGQLRAAQPAAAGVEDASANLSRPANAPTPPPSQSGRCNP